MKKIVIYGGSFNPPGVHHTSAAKALSELFDEVIIIPSGPRPGNPLANDAEPIYRATMSDIAFRGVPKSRIELFDLENPDYTKMVDLVKKYQPEGEIWIAIDSNIIGGGAKGKSKIHLEWENGKKLWKDAHFMVLRKAGSRLDERDLPPHSKILDVAQAGSSEAIRDKLFHRNRPDGLLSPEVYSYINRHGLYLGQRPNRTVHFSLEEIRPLVVVDNPSPEAKKIAAKFKSRTEDKANIIIVIGGDGAMLRAIRKYWRLRIPFYGINAGHLGFLLNDRSASLLPKRQLTLHQLPLLWVEMESPDGQVKTDLAFNDAWVERARGQTAWIRVMIHGKERLSQLMADAALVSTAAGSASYARAMGAQPLPLDTPTLLLVGSNVLRPIGWKSAALPLETEVELIAMDTDKRPLHAFTDGFFHGRVRRMRVRVSQSASVELAFQPEHDPAEKLAQIQFP